MRGATICIFMLYTFAVSALNSTTLMATTSSTTIRSRLEPEYIKCDPSTFESKQCKFGGVCVQSSKTLEYKCNCSSGYTGALCERPRCLNHCYNDGLCQLEANQETCKCISDRYSGEQCQFDKCKDQKCGASCYMTSECTCLCGKDCDSKYCQGNGVCTGYSDRDLSCQCKAGYSGPTCYTDDCLGYCFNGGKCQRNNQNNTIHCDCKPGYKSDHRCGVKDLPVLATSTHRPKTRESVPSDFRSTRIIMYALSITLFICLISIGGYVAIQRGMLTCLLSPFDPKNTADASPLSASYSRHSTFRNGFSKLEEDEESIAKYSEGYEIVQA